ncbi:hypothetical protein GJAV_G00065850 [Gymnothorax javanicus]|nr:hypothetical protein GJAV_G00065850 [Gymnothorax javanicus]
MLLLRNGSVGVDITLIFTNQSSVPSILSVENTINEALNSGNIALNIVPGSVIARETLGTTTMATPTSKSSLQKSHLALAFVALLTT